MRPLPRTSFAFGPPVATIVVSVFAATVAVAIAAVFVRAQGVFLALFAAIVVGEGLRPIVDRIGSRIPRPLAIAATFAIVCAAVALIWLIPVHALAPQLRKLAETLPSEFPHVRARLAQSPVASAISGALVPLGRGLIAANASLAAFVSTAILVLLMAAFWLASADAFRQFVLGRVSGKQRQALTTASTEISQKFAMYVSGSLLTGTIVGIASMALLSWLGAPYALVLGLLQGLFVAIPYLGTLLSILIAGAVILSSQGAFKAVEAIALMAVMEGLEGSFVSPWIFKKKLNIAPLATLLATAVGGAVFGIQGVVLAVPAAIVLQTIGGRVFVPATEQIEARRATQDG